MNKRASVGVKITPSVNNLIFLFLLGFSIFIIYRYVKSLEKELTLLKTELSKMKSAPIKEEQVCVGDVCTTVVTPHPQKEDESEDNDDELDMESVTSKDILKIVDQINDEDDDEDENDDDKNVSKSTEETSTVPLVPPIPIPPVSDEPEKDIETEDIIIKKNTNSYEEDLFKKTNDDLKKILKDQGKNTKGAKAELIKRIIEQL